ncbi:hypothetical protein PIB30_095318 [Stylosanthes scabra]|uniref:GATA transcription factor n=1 Tax=Stylosanthes scabra TaxID=79078 RepID=A0ABU6VUD8_9FABA|nr:hypothetical protein [Stylosanthes scabra]
METPNIFHNSFCSQFASDGDAGDNNNNTAAAGSTGDNFIVEDLLDFSNDDGIIGSNNNGGGGVVVTLDSAPGNSVSGDSSNATVVESCNSSSLSFSGCDTGIVADIGSRSLVDGNFSGELCVPYDDLAELEWLSNFVEESFSSEDLQKMQLISGMKRPNDDASSEAHEFPSEPNRKSPIFNSEVSVPAKARSKRSRVPPCNWASRLHVLSPIPTPTTSSSSEPDVSMVPIPATVSFTIPVTRKKPAKTTGRKKENGDGGSGDGRKCLHCATDKTPQWRTGPMGPKTLCNACGVRYKSGRLVPEYRPAASPTFVLTKHSNSHRKVLELRRQKEMMRAQHHHHHQPFIHQHHHHHHHQNMMFDVPTNADDYLIHHQHVGPDFRQLI